MLFVYNKEETFNNLVSNRRDFHKYPEEGWTEFRTTLRIIEILEKYDIDYEFGKKIHNEDYMLGMPDERIINKRYEEVLKTTNRKEILEGMKGGYTGCIARIRGDLPGDTIGFRFDIDCNNVSESNNIEHLPYKHDFSSEYDNLMHACGHDGHASIGIELAKILSSNRDKLKGEVVIIFQPAEEGGRGANSIVNANRLEGIDKFIAIHLGLNAKKLGTVVTGCNNFLSSDKYDVYFKGKSAHAGASPELGKNALAAAATATLNLLSIPRHSEGASRVNVGILNSGTGRNVIPETAYLAIETRGETEKINSFMVDSALNICKMSANMYKCECNIELVGNTIGTSCDEEIKNTIRLAAENVKDIKEIIDEVDFGAGEDVTYMMNYVKENGGQASLVLIGADMKAPHHNGNFDFDERALLVSLELLINCLYLL